MIAKRSTSASSTLPILTLARSANRTDRADPTSSSDAQRQRCARSHIASVPSEVRVRKRAIRFISPAKSHRFLICEPRFWPS